MAVGQLGLGGDLAEQFRHGGPECGALMTLKDEGLVGKFVLEILRGRTTDSGEFDFGRVLGGFANHSRHRNMDFSFTHISNGRINPCIALYYA